jgi:hypothetical protein
MIKLIGLVKQHRRLSEADELPMDPSVEDASIINKDDILQRLSNIVQELEDIDDELMNALTDAEEQTGSMEYRTAKAVISRYLSAALKNLKRIQRPIKGIKGSL